MSAVGPVVDIDMLPELPVVELALLLTVFTPLDVNVRLLRVILPPLNAPDPVDCACMVAPVRPILPSADVMLIVPAFAPATLAKTDPLSLIPPDPADMAIVAPVAGELTVDATGITTD